MAKKVKKKIKAKFILVLNIIEQFDSEIYSKI